jgi:hypothetical protein
MKRILAGLVVAIWGCGDGGRVQAVDGGRPAVLDAGEGPLDASSADEISAIGPDADMPPELDAGSCPGPSFPPPLPPCAAYDNCLAFFRPGQTPRVTSIGQAPGGWIAAVSEDWLVIDWAAPCAGSQVLAVATSGTTVEVLQSSVAIQEGPWLEGAALDGAAVYAWNASSWGIARYALTGASVVTPVPLTTASPRDYPGPLIVQQGTVWYSDLEGIFALPEEGGAPARVVATQTAGAWPSVFVVGATRLAWVEADTSTGTHATVFAQALGAGAPAAIGTLETTLEATSISLALDPSSETVLAVTSSGVWSAPVDGSGALTLLHAGALLGSFLEVDDTGIYFDEACGSTQGPYQTRRLDRISGSLNWMGTMPGYPFLPHADVSVFGTANVGSTRFAKTDAGIYEVQEQ